MELRERIRNIFKNNDTEIAGQRAIPISCYWGIVDETLSEIGNCGECRYGLLKHQNEVVRCSIFNSELNESDYCSLFGRREK